jgi:hypothetical protein
LAKSQWSRNATAATEKDASFGSKMCSLGSGNFRSVSKGQGGSDRQGVAGHAISQGISNVVSPQDIAIWT